MARRKSRSFLTFLNFYSLFPLWTAMLGVGVASYGWIKDDPDRIHQGFVLVTTFLMCVVFIGVVFAFGWVLRFVGWCYQKVWS